MDNSESLRLKISIMEKELEIEKMRLQYALLIEEQNRSSLASGDKPLKKQADALPKSIIVSSTTQQKESDNPCSSGSKLSSSPVQTASGKDSTNPLKGVAFPKSQENQVQSSRLISEKREILDKCQSSRLITKMSDQELSLKPNGSKDESLKGIMVPNTVKHYYCVFNGPLAGIYEEWKNAKAATENIPNVKHKKFKSLLEANVAAGKYAKENPCETPRLISRADSLKPITFSEVIRQPKETKVSLGKPVSSQPPAPPKEQHEELSLDGFQYWYKAAREADESKLVDEQFFTTDNANLSYFNFVKNANPDQVYEAFVYGLVRTIYPSINLQELRSFPKDFIKAVKKFRTKTSSGKADRDIYLKVSSAIPVFINGEIAYKPHHVIQIGFSKDVQYTPSKVMPTTVEAKDLIELAKRKFNNVLERVFEFNDDSKVFINYVDHKVLLHSKKATTIGEEDVQKILQLRKTVTNHLIFKIHFEDICDLIKKKESSFSCPLCKATALIKGSLQVGTSSSDDSHHMGDDIGFAHIFGGPPEDKPTK
ncbi:ORF6 [Atractylodes mild mottle virus]|uniref:Transactivator/viroplasmin protein n=1 Tax=Atractylodes mild mottle virus TaxID=1711685 RepID=A0A0M3SB61_9VIRU|nr:ORF6 [Atractylodes mild mottle virus]ALD49091.1 ORF6 [Atractylodes mild mottle virus]